jgi:hypothetical protein
MFSPNIAPKVATNGRSDIILIQTSDGLVQTGYAHIEEDQVKRWVITRCYKLEDQPEEIELIDGINYDLSVFKGRITVTGWRPIPNPATLLKILNFYDEYKELCMKNIRTQPYSIGCHIGEPDEKQQQPAPSKQEV